MISCLQMCGACRKCSELTEFAYRICAELTEFGSELPEFDLSLPDLPVSLPGNEVGNDSRNEVGNDSGIFRARCAESARSGEQNVTR